MRLLRPLTLACAILAGPPAAANHDVYVAPADARTADFVRANMIAVFYHELGHALIDVMGLAVLGNEEDAADTLSALLIHQLWKEDTAAALAYDNALAFRLFAEDGERMGIEAAVWGVHSLDMQRYFNLVCLFYGADPQGRAALADELELPDNRRRSCPGEYQKAADSWGAMLNGYVPQDGGAGLRMVVDPGRDPLTALIAEEVAALNREFGLPRWVDVTVERCGEVNAFYDPRAKRIVMCIEYAEEMERLYTLAFGNAAPETTPEIRNPFAPPGSASNPFVTGGGQMPVVGGPTPSNPFGGAPAGGGQVPVVGGPSPSNPFGGAPVIGGASPANPFGGAPVIGGPTPSNPFGGAPVIGGPTPSNPFGGTPAGGDGPFGMAPAGGVAPANPFGIGAAPPGEPEVAAGPKVAKPGDVGPFGGAGLPPDGPAIPDFGVADPQLAVPDPAVPGLAAPGPTAPVGFGGAPPRAGSPRSGVVAGAAPGVLPGFGVAEPLAPPPAAPPPAAAPAAVVRSGVVAGAKLPAAPSAPLGGVPRADVPVILPDGTIVAPGAAPAGGSRVITP
jgi:hypothetical protein